MFAGRRLQPGLHRAALLREPRGEAVRLPEDATITITVVVIHIISLYIITITIISIITIISYLYVIIIIIISRTTSGGSTR